MYATRPSPSKSMLAFTLSTCASKSRWEPPAGCAARRRVVAPARRSPIVGVDRIQPPVAGRRRLFGLRLGLAEIVDVAGALPFSRIDPAIDLDRPRRRGQHRGSSNRIGRFAFGSAHSGSTPPNCGVVAAAVSAVAGCADVGGTLVMPSVKALSGARNPLMDPASAGSLSRFRLQHRRCNVLRRACTPRAFSPSRCGSSSTMP